MIPRVGAFVNGHPCVRCGVQGRPGAVATGEKKNKPYASGKPGKSRNLLGDPAAGRPFVIAQCVRFGRVAPSPPTEYCPNIKTSRAHAPRQPPDRTFYSGANDLWPPPQPFSCGAFFTYLLFILNIMSIRIYLLQYLYQQTAKNRVKLYPFVALLFFIMLPIQFASRSVLKLNYEYYNLFRCFFFVRSFAQVAQDGHKSTKIDTIS